MPTAVLSREDFNQYEKAADVALYDAQAELQRASDPAKVGILVNVLKRIVGGRLDNWTRGGTFAELLKRHLKEVNESGAWTADALRESIAEFANGWTDDAGIELHLRECVPAAIREAKRLSMDYKPLTAFCARRTPETARESLYFATELRLAIHSLGGAGTKPEAGKPALSAEATALAALVENPTWTNQQIAKTAGCHVKSLSRWPNFVAARKAQRAGREQLPKGSKNKETGDVEAWDDDG